MIWLLSGIAIPILVAIWLWCIGLYEEAVAIAFTLGLLGSVALVLHGVSQMGWMT